MALLSVGFAGLLQAVAAAVPPEPPKAPPPKPVDEVVVVAPILKPGPKINLDPHGYFGSREADPYLRRRPSNGCKVTAGGSSTPGGTQGATGGLVCARRF